VRIVGSFWIYAGILEDLQHFSPRRQPSVADSRHRSFAAPFGGLMAASLARCVLNGRSFGYYLT
jgi:hypothetical protein